MKTYHYYATPAPDFKRYDAAQPNELESVDSQITEEMLSAVVEDCANGGKPPFSLFLPSQIIHLDSENLRRCFNLLPSPNKRDGDVTPLDKATVVFPDCMVYIYARRCVPIDTICPKTVEELLGAQYTVGRHVFINLSPNYGYCYLALVDGKFLRFAHGWEPLDVLARFEKQFGPPDSVHRFESWEEAHKAFPNFYIDFSKPEQWDRMCSLVT